MAAAAAIMVSAGSGLSTERKTVPANKTSGVGFFYMSAGLGHNCLSSGRGTFKVTREPKHGKVHVEWRKIKADFQGGCKGRTMGGAAAWYTPEPGYHGDDEFSIRVNFPGLMPGNSFNDGKTWKIKLDVQ